MEIRIDFAHCPVCGKQSSQGDIDRWLKCRGCKLMSEKSPDCYALIHASGGIAGTMPTRAEAEDIGKDWKNSRVERYIPESRIRELREKVAERTKLDDRGMRWDEELDLVIDDLDRLLET